MPIQRECREIVGKHAGEKLGFVNFEGCITARVMLAALQQAGKMSTRQGLVDTLNGMKGVDVGGLQVALTADNHQALNQVFMTQIQDGKIVKIR